MDYVLYSKRTLHQRVNEKRIKYTIQGKKSLVIRAARIVSSKKSELADRSVRESTNCEFPPTQRIRFTVFSSSISSIELISIFSHFPRNFC